MPPIHRFARVDSTMLLAAKLAAEGAPDGTVVVADEQTAGQGRLGRSWHSEPGAGLYLTQILRPTLDPTRLPVITLALGLATAEAIATSTGVAVDLRWPNDVLVGSKKCAGILAQLSDGVLLAGIGINVNHTSFPDDIAGLATSLRLVSGREHNPEELLTCLIGTIAEHLENFFSRGPDPVLRAFTHASSFVQGRRVVAGEPPTQQRGTTAGLDPGGFLMLRRDDGALVRILAGGVRPECS
ncbi:MAG: biotin--[acetyl-CoA-carboxylase] ligase [Bryobacteraceae bacterium]|nr:biotin--[acetyl-CoA-carboxylase] ligase [Bryobacteraceae bacterium]